MELPTTPDRAHHAAGDESSFRPSDTDEEAILDEDPPEGTEEAPAMYSDLVGLEADEVDVLEQSQQVPADDDDQQDSDTF